MATFKNIDFEGGSTWGWIKGGGNWGGGTAPNPVAYLPGGTNYRRNVAEVTITDRGTDEHVGTRLDTVYNGDHSVRVNGSGADYSVSVLTQHVSGLSASTVTFAYAGVIEHSHDTGMAAGFAITVTDITAGETLFAVAYDSETATSVFRRSGDWLYQNWSKVSIDTSTRLGHDLTVTIVAYDCAGSAHEGYVYFDGLKEATGRIAGSLFHDYDANGIADAGEPKLAGWTVYVDENGNNVRDVGEVSAVTDAQGRYLLEGVTLGTAIVRADVPAGTWDRWISSSLTVSVAEEGISRAEALGVTGGATPGDDAIVGTPTDETIDGLAGDDTIKGRGGSDVLVGNAGDDELRGYSGNDTLDGGGGDDFLSGGIGDDRLSGGRGNDLLRGLDGADEFVFEGSFGRDIIADFDRLENDSITIAIAGIDDFSDLVLTQRAGGTLVTLAAGGQASILLRGVDASTLTADTFVFDPPAPEFV